MARHAATNHWVQSLVMTGSDLPGPPLTIHAQAKAAAAGTKMNAKTGPKSALGCCRVITMTCSPRRSYLRITAFGSPQMDDVAGSHDVLAATMVHHQKGTILIQPGRMPHQFVV